MSSLSNWFHGGGQDAQQPSDQQQQRGSQQPLLPHAQEEQVEDLDSVTTIMSGRSANLLSRAKLVRCC